MTLSVINAQTGESVGKKLLKCSPVVTTTNNLKINACISIAFSDILMSGPAKHLTKSTQSYWFITETDSS